MSSITRWLDVEVGNDEIDLNTLPSNIALIDLHNDNEFKLLIGDLGKSEEGPKLKLFRGAMQLSDMLLPDLPLGVVGFFTNEGVPVSLPVIAVAFSSCIYIYRNMKLFYKYYLPSVDLSFRETEIWKQLTDPQNHNTDVLSILVENLNAIPHKVLSPQSRSFLTMSLEQQLEYVELQTEMPVKKMPEVACITTLRMNSVERYSVSCLVVGTEDGEVIVLDPQTFTQLCSAKLCAVKRTPYQMVATGLFSVDYRITVATREKCVCLLKREWSEGRQLFTTDDHIVALEVSTADSSILVICCDNTLACYSRKGKRQWSIDLEHRPVAMTLVPVIHLGVTLTAVALASGHVYLYDGKARRDSIFVRDVVSVMKFGQLGQEEHVFIIVTGTMHASFQQQLSSVRLLAARALLRAHAQGEHARAPGALRPLRLSAQVEGLGPVFRVTLTVENTSADKAVMGLTILFHVPPTNYKVSQPLIRVPLLPPNGQLHLPTKVEEIFEDASPDLFFRPVTGDGGQRSLVRVLLLKAGRSSPVLAATVTMPPTDPMMLPYDKLQETAFKDFQTDNIASRDHIDSLA